jgi:hypothetical protein
MKTLKELILECVNLYKSDKYTNEFEITRDSDGDWSASIGGNGNVSVGEWCELFSTFHAEPEDAVLELTAMVKNAESIRASRKQRIEEASKRMQESGLHVGTISVEELTKTTILAPHIDVTKKD